MNKWLRFENFVSSEVIRNKIMENKSEYLTDHEYKIQPVKEKTQAHDRQHLMKSVFWLYKQGLF